MTQTTTTTQPTNTISARAMLSDLTVSVWSGRKYDKKVSDEVADIHGATQDAGRYNKRLIAKSALAKIQEINRKAFDAYYTATMPWADSGLRIFPSALYIDFVSKMKSFEREFAIAADDFAAVYPQVIADAKRDLNGLFKESDYPKPSEIRARFAFKVTLMPLPDMVDFRIDVGDEAMKRLQADWKRDQDAMMSAAIADVADRIRDVVGRMAERLHAYNPTGANGKAEGVFRDTLVSNVRDLAAILPALNVTDDARLSDIIDRIQASLTKYEPNVLRDNSVARQETADAADAILAHVNSFFA